ASARAVRHTGLRAPARLRRLHVGRQRGLALLLRALPAKSSARGVQLLRHAAPNHRATQEERLGGRMSDASKNPTPDTELEHTSDSELERLRALVEYLGEANEQLETVNRIVAAVNTSRSIEEVFELASEQV